MCNLTRGFRSFVDLLVKTQLVLYVCRFHGTISIYFALLKVCNATSNINISCLVWNIHIFALSAIKTA